MGWLIYTLNQPCPTKHIRVKPHKPRMDGQPSSEPSSARSDQLDMKAYTVSRKATKMPKPHVNWEAPIDWGANGCIAGWDARVPAKSDKTVDLSGLDDHSVRNLYLVAAGAVVRTQMGKMIIILHQAADMTRYSKTMLSDGQLENFGCLVKDQSLWVSKIIPNIVTVEGYRILVTIKKGLPYIQIRPFMDIDWNNLPHITITSPNELNPISLDSSIS